MDSTLSLPITKDLSTINMNRVAALILSGGVGTRLAPLTLSRCKPAICFGGRYRLIDVPISNALNSGCRKLFVITQFLSSSLHQHLLRTYRQDLFGDGFLDILTVEQKPQRQHWFQGTADAIRQNIEYLLASSAEEFLILSGDQLYAFDFREMVAFARSSDADVIVAAQPISAKDASRMGVLQIDAQSKIKAFIEKPQDENLLLHLRNLQRTDKPYLGSMGIYLFKRRALVHLLEEDPREDFGKHLIPTAVQQGRAAAFVYNGYWEDIGTVEAFYEANMALTRHDPPLDCYNEEWPLHFYKNPLPGSKIHNSTLDQSIVNDGCTVENSVIKSSILGPRTRIKSGCHIEGCYVMGNDTYHQRSHANEERQLFIDENCQLRNTIVDKQVHIGKGVQLLNRENRRDYDSSKVYIRDGIIVVPHGTTLPDGFTI